MKKGSDKLLIIIVALVVYIIAMVVIINDVNGKMTGLNKQIKEKQEILDQLNYDLAHIKDLEMERDRLEVFNNRSDEFLMSKANVLNGIVYVDKLASVMGKSIDSIVIGSTKSSQAGKNNEFYQFNVKFGVDMTYEEIEEIIQYIEGGALKLKITDFKISPASVSKATRETQTGEEEATENEPELENVKMFRCDLGVSYFSINEHVFDKLERINENPLIESGGSGASIFGTGKKKLTSQ